MKRFFHVLYDFVVFIAAIGFVYGVYHRFWMPESWFRP